MHEIWCSGTQLRFTGPAGNLVTVRKYIGDGNYELETSDGRIVQGHIHHLRLNVDLKKGGSDAEVLREGSTEESSGVL